MKRDAWTDTPETDLGVLRFMTCGSVDDGKSTLIGRLLYDTKALLSDTLAVLHKTSQRRGQTTLDLALLTDGLLAEREQGITIDVAYRYFATARRKFIIADSPGHEQYTRNMVTAASTADAAVLLIDARKGLLPQTRRHAVLATLLGVRHLVLAVNKMDLISDGREVFETITEEFRHWLAGQADQGAEPRLASLRAVPLSALNGDMVVERGRSLGWYDGPTLLELLESLPTTETAPPRHLRLPVQWVCRPVDGSSRGYAGRIEAGTLTLGEEVRIWPGGQRSRIACIRLGNRELLMARAGQSVMVSLSDERDISRGDLIMSGDDSTPASTDSLSASVCWLAGQELVSGQTFLLQHLTREVRARVEMVESVLDVDTLAWQPGPRSLTLNDIGRVRIRTQQPLPADPYHRSRATGSFILVDPATRGTVAAGLIEDLR